MRFLFLIGVFSLAAAHAQHDTTYLKEVAVYGMPVTKYAIGSKIDKITTGEQVQTLADALGDNVSLYLKNYGNNQLSTIALRGTTSSQTAVLWHGININSPTLGQTDLSLVPMFLFDEASLQYGTTSSRYGSDAIGGTILLGQSQPNFAPKYAVSVNQLAGSFGRQASGLKINYGTSQLQWTTKGYHTFVKNDFKYLSPAIGHEKKQQNAAVENIGIDQQIDFKISDKQILSAEGMYTDNFRHIQPSVTNDRGNETLRDRNFRSAITYRCDLKFLALTATAAYIFSDQDYTNNETTNVKSRQLSGLFNADHALSATTNLRYGVLYNYYTATSANFENVNDNRSDVFVSYLTQLSPRNKISLNARQSFYKNRYTPFAPTIGYERLLLKKMRDHLALRAQAGRGFRVPTLNDRYWNPGGNPNLMPERAVQFEGGLDFTRRTEQFLWKVNTTAYRTWVREMIVWMDAGNNWSPVNLQNVNIAGLETECSTSVQLGGATLKNAIAYSFVRSLNQSPNDPSTDMKQLPYVPRHAAQITSQVVWRKWDLIAGYHVTGVRQTSLDNAGYLTLPAYGLFNVGLLKRISKGRWSFNARGDVNNLFNIYYENLLHRAMPGRNFQISLIITNKS